MQKFKILALSILIVWSNLSHAAKSHPQKKSEETKSNIYRAINAGSVFSVLASLFYTFFQSKSSDQSPNEGLNRFDSNPSVIPFGEGAFLFASREITIEVPELKAKKNYEIQTNEIPENILLLIDVQEKFDATKSRSLQIRLLEEIRRAIEAGDLIICVEYEACGSTLQNILDSIQSYPYVHIIRKTEDSGGSALTSLFNQIGVKCIKNIRVCGVNTNVCVYKTADSLTKMACIENIIVVGSACNSLPSVTILPNGQSLENAYWLGVIERNVARAKVLWSEVPRDVECNLLDVYCYTPVGEIRLLGISRNAFIIQVKKLVEFSLGLSESEMEILWFYKNDNVLQDDEKISTYETASMSGWFAKFIIKKK